MSTPVPGHYDRQAASRVLAEIAAPGLFTSDAADAAAQSVNGAGPAGTAGPLDY